MRIDAYSLAFTSHYESAQSSLSRVSQKGEMVHTLSLHNESESLDLLARGTVMTQEGMVDLELLASLSRKERYVQESLVHQSAIDPLVINFKGELASVDTKKKFSFDLNSDGKKEMISLLGSGNGFLAIDKNNNGAIDDGSELFGTKSGDGFADLALFDDDKNGVIDEQDSVFEKLLVWHKSALDEGILTLKQARVGALLLDNVASMFHYKNEGESNATLQKSGVVLFEGGKAGWVSHLDFMINEEVQSMASEQGSSNEQQNALFSVSSLLPSSSENDSKQESLIEILKKRLSILQNKLSKTSDDSQKEALNIQILSLSQHIAMLEMG